ncbi:helix-hairpin-helix domain-containing protein [Pseudoflavitalea sp. G-6-1-2]|uniref:helix-hairpin-helix domain-containing protein n=1 Tax=Pseudoflavitalea sp. G-6-1-2 TaxID=2728841 RepID=UPI00146AA3F4|nr:helix-hairpin-helix domain-containing protein [Pseudoflavitalea sp. G-6-1-2]NML22702.1 helix-hairpin-helix domain-containing protein [Pseudoflavitalea sp. G-6-1-2]
MMKGKIQWVQLVRTGCIIAVCLLQLHTAKAQEEENNGNWKEQLLEQLADREESIPEDDDELMAMDQFIRHPIALNEATAAQLQLLQILHPWQINNFLLYRSAFGKLLSRYELQAIPGWDSATIRQLLPYVTLNEKAASDRPLFRRFRGGEQQVLLRSGKLFKEAKPAVFVRYRYQFKQQLQWGFTGEKDAGESFFRGAQKEGFDHTGFHLFVRRIGPLQALAIGDFQVNLGQGLIQWQSMSFAPTPVLSIKKQSEWLKPYSAAGELNYHRGIAVSAGNKHLKTGAFFSYRKVTGRTDTDSSGEFLTGFDASGYHRTVLEQQRRKNTTLMVTGAMMQYKTNHWHLGFNAVGYRTSKPFRPPPALYRKFGIEGNTWHNASIDGSATLQNFHLFWEWAVDKRMTTAFTAGTMISLSRHFNMAIHYRNFSKKYQALFSSAIAQNASPGNEEGWLLRWEWQPARNWKLQGSADIFRFPWLKYRIDAPAIGHEYLFMAIYQPSRRAELQFRYQHSLKPLNANAENVENQVIKYPGSAERRQWRWQCLWKISENFSLKQRVDYLLAGIRRAGNLQTGISAFMEATRRVGRKWMFNTRLHFFDTDTYESRIYGMERDLLYSYSMPAFAGKAIRTYALARCKWGNQKAAKRGWEVECWLKMMKQWPADLVNGSLTETGFFSSAELKIQLIGKIR